MNLTDSNQAQNIDTKLAILTIAMQLVSLRILTTISLLLNAGVVSWAMWTESWIRLAGAAVFAITSWCIVNLKPPKGPDHEA